MQARADAIQPTGPPAPPAHATAPVAGPPPAEAAASPATSAQDPYQQIRALARSAFDGDGDAQYRVARLWEKCEMTLSLVRRSPDPEAALVQGLTPQSYAEAYAEAQRLAEALRSQDADSLQRLFQPL